ncbi:MAG: hypothetical protein JWR01_2685 [Subtercola sp.]|nr:hypothetical protein [Subtercola sp.]
MARRQSIRNRVADTVLMRDLGLTKLTAGLQVLVCIPAGLAVGYLVAVAVGLPPIVGMMIGALPAFLTCLLIADEKASRIAARSAVSIIPFVVALFASLALQQERLLELALIVVLLFAQFYAARFGVWAADTAAVFFTGYLCGLLLPLPLTSFESLGMVGAASLAATILLRTLFFRPNAFRSLMRTRRAFLAWSGRVVDASIDLLEHGTDDGIRQRLRLERRLRHRLVQLHEAGLTADGLLARPGSGPTGEAAESLHRLLFDTEFAVDGIGRVALDLAHSPRAEEARGEILGALRLVRSEGGRYGEYAAENLVRWLDEDAVGQAPGIRRLATLLADLTDSANQWRSLSGTLPRTEGVPFASPVVLAFGRVSGAVPVLGDALASGAMSGPWRRWRISAPLRTAVQAAVAVALVEPLAFALGGDRFYWGVIGVMIILTGTNSTHERLLKVAKRGIGTVVGGLLGILLVDLLGTDHPWWSLAVIVVFLAVGVYSIVSNYAIWVVCLVIVICQVYVFSGQFEDALLPLRLAENLLGALVAVGVSMIVLPVATSAIIRSAIRRQLDAVGAFLGSLAGETVAREDLRAAEGPAARPSPESPGLRADARAVDLATYQLDAVMKPMMRVSVGGRSARDDETRAILVGVNRYLRVFATRADAPGSAQAEALDDRALVQAETLVLADSVRALAEAAGQRRGEPARGWRRVREQRTVSPWAAEHLALLVRIDSALVPLAELYGLAAHGRDPVRVPSRA